MIVIIWIINLLLPIINILGIFGLCYAVTEGDFPELWFWCLSGGAFVLGFLFGMLAWHYDVPPRWFWVKSRLELFDNLIGSAFGYGLSFALIPFAVLIIIFFAGM